MTIIRKVFDAACACTSSRLRGLLATTSQTLSQMETTNMSASVPHSVVHARSYIPEVEKSPVTKEKKNEPGVKGVVRAIRSRRRGVYRW